MNSIQREDLARFWTVVFNNTPFLWELTNKFYICLFFRYVMLLTSCDLLWNQRPFTVFLFVKLTVYWSKLSYKFLKVPSVFCRTYLILSYSQTHPQGNSVISVSVFRYHPDSLLYWGSFVPSENLISMRLFYRKVTYEIKQGWFQSRSWGFCFSDLASLFSLHFSVLILCSLRLCRPQPLCSSLTNF